MDDATFELWSKIDQFLKRGGKSDATRKRYK